MFYVDAKLIHWLMKIISISFVIFVSQVFFDIRKALARDESYHVTSNLSLSLQSPIQTWTQTKAIQCAVRCNVADNCRSFTWDSADDTCTIGGCAFATGGMRSADDSKKLYVRRDTCRYDLGYELRSYNSTTRCLYLSSEQVTYDEAIASCSNLGGRLSKANTLEIVDMITELAFERDLGIYDRIFVGLTDRTSENTFVWVDGEAMTPDERSKLFREGQPDSSGDEDCGEITLFHSRLNDNRCDRLTYYTCERDC